VKKLVFFHHDPNRKDDELEQLEKDYQANMRGKTSMELMVAREGLVVEA
jgi:phosphoribosyl 1,2-cyclic phosphodiesterase